MAEAQQSDALKNLVWFMIGLAILGTILALVLYYCGVITAGSPAATVPTNCYIEEGTGNLACPPFSLYH